MATLGQKAKVRGFPSPSSWQGVGAEIGGDIRRFPQSFLTWLFETGSLLSLELVRWVLPDGAREHFLSKASQCGFPKEESPWLSNEGTHGTRSPLVSAPQDKLCGGAES